VGRMEFSAKTGGGGVEAQADAVKNVKENIK
jgi:ribosomal protein S9